MSDRPDIACRRLGGLQVAVLDRPSLARRMTADCRAARSASLSRPRLVFSANGHALSMNATDPEFASFMSAADLLHADGQPLVIWSRLTPGLTIPERAATTDFFHDAAKEAVREGLSFYFIGGRADVLQQAVERVSDLYPGLAIAGFRDGYFPRDRWREVALDIAAARPDVVWVGLGRPWQERFCVEARDLLAGTGWLKTCGGLFGHLAGTEARAPRWMQVVGLEWLYRLLQDPRGKGRRYLVTNLYALWLLVTRSGK
jgi:exopolysaccharide biosynthesis WecB/TagA/CpsF family protein